MQTVNIRTLKDKLSAYLREVARGETVLVTDRGRVVAEIRRPTVSQAAADALQEKIERLADQGVLKRGLPNAPEVYRKRIGVTLPAEVIDEALGWTREDKA